MRPPSLRGNSRTDWNSINDRNIDYSKLRLGGSPYYSGFGKKLAGFPRRGLLFSKSWNASYASATFGFFYFWKNRPSSSASKKGHYFLDFTGSNHVLISKMPWQWRETIFSIMWYFRSCSIGCQRCLACAILTHVQCKSEHFTRWVYWIGQIGK